MHDIPDKVITKAKKTLKTRAAELNRGAGVCAGDVLSITNGESIVRYYHNACHAWLSNTWCTHFDGTDVGVWDFSNGYVFKEGQKPFLFLTCHTQKGARAGCSEEAVRNSIHWIAKESPFSEHCVNKDDDESLENGAILVCGPDALSLSEAMWIAKFLRFSTEAPAALVSWNVLYKNGINPFFAAYVASYIQKSGKSFIFHKVIDHVSIFDRAGGYRAASPKAVDFKSLVKGATFKGAMNTSLLFGTDKKMSTTSVLEQIKKLCEPVQIDDGWGGKTSGAKADEKTLVALCAELQKKLAGEDIGEPIPDREPVVRTPAKDAEYLDFDM